MEFGLSQDQLMLGDSARAAIHFEEALALEQPESNRHARIRARLEDIHGGANNTAPANE